ncbi:unnamed protein product [Amoebophrya sp. A120]|nr:unnamed protein product [Amoebophrya sp. A120]|eukprot:GSA120T00023818001.1
MPIMLRSKTSAAALMAAAASFPTCAVVPVEAVMMPIPSRTSTPQPDKAGPPYKDEAAVTTDVPDAVLQIADAAVTTSDVITEAKEAMERANTTKGLAMDSAAKAKGHAEEAIKFANKDDPERYDLTKAQDKLQTAIGEAKAAAAHIEGLRAEVEAAQTQAAAAHIEGLHAEVEAAQTQIQTQTLIPPRRRRRGPHGGRAHPLREGTRGSASAGTEIARGIWVEQS